MATVAASVGGVGLSGGGLTVWDGWIVLATNRLPDVAISNSKPFEFISTVSPHPNPLPSLGEGAGSDTDFLAPLLPDMGVRGWGMRAS
jgi:hypothetical protein